MVRATNRGHPLAIVSYHCFLRATRAFNSLLSHEARFILTPERLEMEREHVCVFLAYNCCKQ